MTKTPAELRQLIEEFNKKNDYGIEEDDLIETLRDNEIDRISSTQHRWWHEYQCVSKVGDIFIQWNDATADGDNSAEEKGWEMRWGKIVEVEPVQKTITTWAPKE